MNFEEIEANIDRLKRQLDMLNLSTNQLLRLVPHFRLDWGEAEEGFSDDFNIGATKPVLLSGLANQGHKIKTNGLLFRNSKIAGILFDTFLTKTKLTKQVIVQIHQEIIRNGGKWREQDVIIKDYNNIITPPFTKVDQIESHIDELINWYNDEVESSTLHPLTLASIFHYNLVKIHPFIDANGRLARIISSLILLKYGFPPPVTKYEDRREYLSAIRNADTGEIKPLVAFLADKVGNSLNYLLSIKA